MEENDRLAIETTINNKGVAISEKKEERVIIDVPSEGNYIEILGYRIDGYNSFVEFCDYLKKFDQLEKETIKQKEQIKMCLDFIDDLLPRYLEEKHHIILGDDWELNRSIYVMSELRDILMGFKKGE